MIAEFYLFDVDHGQCAALRLPNGRWCIFDLGRTAAFSPIAWIVENEACRVGPARFLFLKATVSHLHADHLADYTKLFRHGFESLKTVDADEEYMADCWETCANNSSWAKIQAFTQMCNSRSEPARSSPNYGAVKIRELCLPVDVARLIGGDANARVNNASVVTRIDVYGNSILLCGDMQKEAWEAIIADRGDAGRIWRAFLSDIDILVAPHHGHRSGYSSKLLNLAKPAVVLVSVVTRDPNVDSRYSQHPVRGLTINGTPYHCITTRQKGHIKVEVRPPDMLAGQITGDTYWSFGDAALSSPGG